MTVPNSKSLKSQQCDIAEKEKKKILEKYKQLTGIQLEQKENIPQVYQWPSKIALENASDRDDEHDFEELEYVPPPYISKVNYYDLYWKKFTENERIMNEIQNLSIENEQTESKIYHLQNYYEQNLLPKMFAFPHQYVARIISNKNFAEAP